MEIVPGIYRIESILGPRPFSQYVLRGDRSLLVDTGIVSTPDDVILPYFRTIGLDPSDLTFVVNTHADVDHFGGNSAIARAAPRALFCAHAADAAWIEDTERILQERYGWYAGHDVGYDTETATWLREAMGPAVPIDVQLAGGERFRLGAHLAIDVLHLPGHSPGHIGLWDAASRTAIVTDAVLAGGLFDTEGNIISPPPYFDATAYERSVALLHGLAPQRLLTAHYAILEGEDVARFLADSAAFVQRCRDVVTDVVSQSGELTLRQLFESANPQLGPFTAMANELCGPLRAHLNELVSAGRAQTTGSSPEVWRAVSHEP